MFWIRIERFLGLPDPNPSLFVRIRNLKQKTKKKPLISTVLWLLYDFLSLQTNVNTPSKSNKQNNLEN